ncbi:MAG TPA: AI-2E family transporter [Chitinophagaceae bacterium]|nr:AI-2E family transporter [Chitinophagaceae bacterium]
MDFNIKIPANKVRQVLFLASILTLGLILYLQMTFMLGAFLGAIALYMLLRKMMYKLVFEKHWKKWIAASVLMLLSFIVIVLPFAWIGYILADKITPIIHNPDIITQTADKIQDYLNQRFGMDILSEPNLAKITNAISNLIPKVLSSTANTLVNVVVAYFLLWFLLTNAGKVELWLQRNLPFKPENRKKVIQEVKESVLSNAVGLPIMGAIQGALAVLGYWMFDAPDPLLWGIVTGICSFIPFVGTMAAWVPIALLSFAAGDTNNGLAQVAWGLVVIGGSDNVFRMILQKKLGNIHPMITVFGVIIGLNMFGFLGLIFGPLLISLFLLLVKIYLNEFVDKGVHVDVITHRGDDKDEDTLND